MQAKEYMRIGSFFTADHVSRRKAEAAAEASVSGTDADARKKESTAVNEAAPKTVVHTADNTALPDAGPKDNIHPTLDVEKNKPNTLTVDTANGAAMAGPSIGASAAVSAADAATMSESKKSDSKVPRIQPRVTLERKTINFRRSFLTREGVKLFNLKVYMNIFHSDNTADSNFIFFYYSDITTNSRKFIYIYIIYIFHPCIR